MAIEPLGSIMTVQAQQVQTQSAKPVAVNMEVNQGQQQVNNIDPSTVSVAKTGDTPQQQTTNTGEQQQSDVSEGQIAKQQNEKIKKAVEMMTKNMSNSEAVFGIHEATNRVTIKIIDKDTKEVIKELPPEKTLDMIAKVWELAGIMVDERR